MDNKAMLQDLNELVQLDIDAIRLYDQALDNIDHPTLHSQLSSFKADHARHVNDLSMAIRRLGGEPPKHSPDIKGVLLEGFTAIRSMTGNEGALKAMRTNETLTNKIYDKARQWDLPLDIKQIVERNYSDEKRHLAYIEQAIENKVWQTSEV